MLLMSGSDINKSYGIDAVLEDVSFNVNKGDRIGIVVLTAQAKPLFSVSSQVSPARRQVLSIFATAVA